MNICNLFMFIFLLFFNNLLLASNLKQIITCEDNIISSYFLVNNSDNTDPIQLVNFTNEDVDIYRKFLFCENKACDLEKANTLFEKILLRKDIPFAYTDDGCFARAHVISNYLYNKGIKTGKIWLTGGDIINPSNKDSKWDYHVAATIDVKTNNNIETLVIDPSIVNQKLLTIEEWFSLHQIKNYPQIVSYPLPRNSFLELPIVSFSSDLAFYPFKIDLTISEEELLEEARKVNLDNLNNLNS